MSIIIEKLKRRLAAITEQLEDTKAARAFVIEAGVRVSQIREGTKVRSIALERLEEAALWLNKQASDCATALGVVNDEIAAQAEHAEQESRA